VEILRTGRGSTGFVRYNLPALADAAGIAPHQYRQRYRPLGPRLRLMRNRAVAAHAGNTSATQRRVLADGLHLCFRSGRLSLCEPARLLNQSSQRMRAAVLNRLMHSWHLTRIARKGIAMNRRGSGSATECEPVQRNVCPFRRPRAGAGLCALACHRCRPDRRHQDRIGAAFTAYGVTGVLDRSSHHAGTCCEGRVVAGAQELTGC
jgi:hypothetical protein